MKKKKKKREMCVYMCERQAPVYIPVFLEHCFYFLIQFFPDSRFCRKHRCVGHTHTYTRKHIIIIIINIVKLSFFESFKTSSLEIRDPGNVAITINNQAIIPICLAACYIQKKKQRLFTLTPKVYKSSTYFFLF